MSTDGIGNVWQSSLNVCNVERKILLLATADKCGNVSMLKAFNVQFECKLSYRWLDYDREI